MIFIFWLRNLAFLATPPLRLIWQHSTEKQHKSTSLPLSHHISPSILIFSFHCNVSVSVQLVFLRHECQNLAFTSHLGFFSSKKYPEPNGQCPDKMRSEFFNDKRANYKIDCFPPQITPQKRAGSICTTELELKLQSAKPELLTK